MDIYMIYKKSDLSITGFVFEDDHNFVETDTHKISTNKIEWLEEKSVGDDILIKTYEDVEDTINDTHQIRMKSPLNKFGVVELRSSN